jgi:hypothetical protein
VVSATDSAIDRNRGVYYGLKVLPTSPRQALDSRNELYIVL